MPEITSALIADIVGPVAAQEFDNAKDTYKPGLLDWARKLRDLSDDEFHQECVSAIYDSALGSNFRGNWEHEHFKASACFHESERRHHEVAGHSKDCRGDTLYAKAHRQLMREHHYETHPPADCNCR